MTQRPTLRLKEWLDNQIRSSTPGKRLPTGKILARTFNLSEITVKKVLRTYTKSGKLYSARGMGTFIPSNKIQSADIMIEPPKSSVENIVEHLDNLISRGILKRNEALPPIKTITIQFKVTAATVIKAYKRLQKIGRITKVGKTFWVGSFDRIVFSHPQKEVYFFHEDSADLNEAFNTGFVYRAYRKLQSELIFNGYLLRFEPVSQINKLFSQWLKKCIIPYGLIFYNVNSKVYPKIKEPVELFTKRVKKQSGYCPKILFDWSRGYYESTGRAITDFQRGHVTTSASRKLASYLIENSFKSIAFFTSHTDKVWQASWVSSFLKIRTELQPALYKCTIRFFVWPSKTANEKVAPSKITQSSFFTSHANWLGDWFQKYQSQSIEGVRHEIIGVKDLNEAVSKTDKSKVWIFSRDKDAVGALSMTQAGKHAIIGLEDDPNYYHFGLSCCIPDWETIGYQMAHTIIGDIPVKKTHKNFLATNAIMLERLTTRI